MKQRNQDPMVLSAHQKIANTLHSAAKIWDKPTTTITVEKMTQEEQTTTPIAERPKPSAALFKKVFFATQSAYREALSSTDKPKYANDLSFVIVGVGLNNILEEVKAPINRI